MSWPITTCGRDSLVASLVCVLRIGKLYSNTADCIPITYPLFYVRLVEPSQIVLSHGAVAHESQIPTTTFRGRE
jgi:hypothetical protein